MPEGRRSLGLAPLRIGNYAVDWGDVCPKAAFKHTVR